MFSIPTAVVLKGMLVFLRVSGILFAMPIFGDKLTPVRVRILLSVALAYIIYPVVPESWSSSLPRDVIPFAILVIKESLIGITLGYCAKLAFDGIVMAASVIGYQMGFGTASLMVPDAGAPLSPFAAFHRIVFLLIFLLFNLHMFYIKALVDTFQMIQAGGFGFDRSIVDTIIIVSRDIFITALQLAAPILISLMFTMSALGLLARTVPQMQVFQMSFPLSFFLGIIIYIALIPMYPEWASMHFKANIDQINSLIRSMSMK